MLELKNMDAIPPHENPFSHDAISVGASLDSIGLPDVYVMDGGVFANGLYIVNTATGQRVRIRGIDALSADAESLKREARRFVLQTRKVSSAKHVGSRKNATPHEGM